MHKVNLWILAAIVMIVSLLSLYVIAKMIYV
jgi:hypothetical protein